MDKIRKVLLNIILGKGGDEMMALLWAQQIMMKPTLEEAHAMYQRVPRLLKEQVRQILIDSGCENLIAE